MDILNGFQKLVSTRWTFSISIGLERRDPHAYIKKQFGRLIDLAHVIFNVKLSKNWYIMALNISTWSQ